MKNKIPNELVMALASDAKLREQFTSMYLVQQEIMTVLITQLHHQGLINACSLADHVLETSQSPELDEPTQSLARMFHDRLHAMVASPPNSASDWPSR